MSDASTRGAGSGAFFGRRKGHRLRDGQAELYGSLLPRLRIDPAGDLSPAALFDVPVRDLHVEIGFGGGEHLLMQARAHPEIGFIGCEPFVNGMAKMLSAIEREGLRNIRLHDADALEVLERLPAETVARIYLLYPDPWPKRRQHKRRFVSERTLALMAGVLKPGAEFRFASDIDHYVGWTLSHVFDCAALEWTAEGPDDWRKPWPEWQSTRYESKARREGRASSYLTFRRR